MVTIRNHKIENVDYQESPNHSGVITPKFIVQHYTAGYSGESAIDILTRSGSGVSAHVVIDLDGTITQLVPFNVKAWHAGPSSHMGYSGLNNHSIGIEIVNIGYLRQIETDVFEDPYGNTRYAHDFPNGFVVAPNSRVGSGTFYWPRYTREQLDAVDDLTAKLVQEYPIKDIVSHEEIDTRGWKTDPGPAFPMKLVKRHLKSDRGCDHEYYEVTASRLNVRSGPGTRYEVIKGLDKGNQVEIHERDGRWARISDDGWVHSSYLRVV